MTPSRLKIDLFMPLEIGRYLQDTAHLDIAKSGAYLHLLMHYWSHGPLPNDPDQLAAIAKMSGDAWSIAYAILKQFFSIGQDGLLHQVGADRRLEFWKGKKQKAHEKAQKAARARWDKEKAKRVAKSDAPSIAQGMLEQCPISVSEEEQKQKQPPPTPSAARRGIDALADAPSITIPPIGELAGETAWSGLHGGAQDADLESEENGKTVLNGVGEVAAGVLRGYQQAGHSGRVAVHQKRIAPGGKNGVRPTKVDPRKNACKAEISRYWAGQNPEHPKIEFQPADERALDALLEHDRELTVEEFRRLLRNRADSDVNPSALPYQWLRKLRQYSSGPLGPYSKPLTRSRSV